MNILIIAPSWLGDALIAQPLLALLRQAEPAARIEVLASPWTAPLFSRMAEVDALLDHPFGHGRFDLAGRYRLGRALARRPGLCLPGIPLRGPASADFFDRAYVLPNSWKSALMPFFAGIPKRIGYHGEARFCLLTDRRRLDPQRHPRLVERYAALAFPAGHPLPAELPRTHLASSGEVQRAARLALGLPLDVAPYIFCPGAEYGPAKRWPAAHFTTLARLLASPGHPVWLLGSNKDAALGEEIAAATGGQALNLCGRTTVTQAIDLIAGAQAVISNDSGLMHVAAALDRPLVALYGSSSPGYTPPLSPRAKILYRHLPCSPCFERDCPLGHFDCLNGLAPETIAAAVAGAIATSDNGS
ncbi:MAG: lipopolysaccharide heptosyltransferase II [Betaproteobacteria bacterium HGW-Betaproteobacteria-11]|nr:MAG: lipopolysaccharide heptosyltransferase II [Betaproteobacteria bacterium HGW-Betaproteobacteria-11]